MLIETSLRLPLTVFSLAAVAILSGCAIAPETPYGAAPERGAATPLASLDAVKVANRLTWGIDGHAVKDISEAGVARFVNAQLKPPDGDALPAEVARSIAALGISQRPTVELVLDLERHRKEMDAIKDDAEKKNAQEAYQKELTGIAREAASRSLLRALYSPYQLREQMTWFWMNHFNVHQYKANIRALVGDYEDRAIRPYALGRFRDLVMATLRHPAMIRYLDNEQNAANHINENYARELLELHTLGVDGGYSQRDVQELARVLTGVGVNLTGNAPNVRAELRDLYIRDGLFEFNPMRHDPGVKVVLGHSIKGRGFDEIEQAVDILCRHPATARFVSRKLAVFFVADDPPAAMVDRMAATFTRTDGDIAAVLRTMIESPAFSQSLGHKFKDPMHFVLSAVRLAYDDRPILNTGPVIGWLNRLGEANYNRQTPDGYPLSEAAWSSSGQMNTRFEIARAIGSGSAGLFKAEGMNAVEQAAFPRLANGLYFQALEGRLGASTRAALDKATSPQEWNIFLLSSPDFMYR
jgi:uncharacterized protein (DUF1800 family)